MMPDTSGLHLCCVSVSFVRWFCGEQLAGSTLTFDDAVIMHTLIQNMMFVSSLPTVDALTFV